MKTKIKKYVDIDVRYLHADLAVGYFEDAFLNGKRDDADEPKMPCIENGHWKIEIDIDNGIVMNWKKGNTAIIHYKVCDEGFYQVFDENHELVYEKEDYVPTIFSQDDIGYGDYVYITIEEDGKIKNWNVNSEMLKQLTTGGFGKNEEDDED